MLEVTDTTVIGHPPETVFAAAADPFVQLKWDPNTLKRIEQTSGDGLAKGARYRGEFKGFGTVEYEYAEYAPPRSFEHLARMKMGTMHHRFTFEAAPEGTRLTQVGRLDPNLLGRIMSPMLKKGLRQRFRTIGAELQSYLDAGPA